MQKPASLAPSFPTFLLISRHFGAVPCAVPEALAQQPRAEAAARSRTIPPPVSTFIFNLRLQPSTSPSSLLSHNHSVIGACLHAIQSAERVQTRSCDGQLEPANDRPIPQPLSFFNFKLQLRLQLDRPNLALPVGNESSDYFVRLEGRTAIVRPLVVIYPIATQESSPTKSFIFTAPPRRPASRRQKSPTGRPRAPVAPPMSTRTFAAVVRALSGRMPNQHLPAGGGASGRSCRRPIAHTRRGRILSRDASLPILRLCGVSGLSCAAPGSSERQLAHAGRAPQRLLSAPHQPASPSRPNHGAIAPVSLPDADTLAAAH
jgi:hypothetical protein